MNQDDVSRRTRCGSHTSIGRRNFMGTCGLSALAAVPALAQFASAESQWAPGEKPNEPMGEAKGVFPGRVVWAHDPAVATWDGNKENGGWWEDKFTDPDLAESMFRNSLRRLTGEETEKASWEALFRHYNRTHGRGDAGYRQGEKVAVKLNMNCSSRERRSHFGLYSTPQLTQALLRQLVKQAGVPEEDIVVCDSSRWMNDTIFTPGHAEFPKIRFEDRDGGEGRFAAVADKQAALHFGDPDTPSSGTTYLPESLTGATYVINAASMKGHVLAGVTLCAKNHFGSVFRTDLGPNDVHKGWNPSHMHSRVLVAKRPMGTYNPLVDLIGHRHLGGKTILYLIDALYAAEHQDAEPQKWLSSPFDGHWTGSLFLSQDPVAIESVAVDFFAAEKTSTKMVGAVDNYLHEAALAPKPPSGTPYAPSGDGKRLASLGVHEHWNSPEKRQYSRNLGTGEGIELVKCG